MRWRHSSAANRFQSTICVRKMARTANGKGLMSLLGLAASMARCSSSGWWAGRGGGVKAVLDAGRRRRVGPHPPEHSLTCSTPTGCGTLPTGINQARIPVSRRRGRSRPRADTEGFRIHAFRRQEEARDESRVSRPRRVAAEEIQANQEAVAKLGKKYGAIFSCALPQDPSCSRRSALVPEQDHAAGTPSAASSAATRRWKVCQDSSPAGPQTSSTSRSRPQALARHGEGQPKHLLKPVSCSPTT